MRLLNWTTFIVVAGYIFTLATSGLIFRHFVGGEKPEQDSGESTSTGFDMGTLIGKCENLIILTFVLAGAFTGLALIFAGKPIARADQIKEYPEYYLAGTVVNFTYSLIIGFLLRWVLTW